LNAAARVGQTAALLLDAYRELNSKKLFWVTLVLSLLVVLACAALGINDRGITLLGWEFDTAPLTAGTLPPAKFYLFLFANLAVPIWLTWLATILALVSTASIVPDFLASGAIELTLARPISRLRLFAVKYACGLLFVTLQVAVFAAACFVVVGLRGGSWEPRIFLAVPIVVVFFSYLYSFCVLFGVLTRSTIAALLLTLLVWLGLWSLNTTARLVVMMRETAAVKAERAGGEAVAVAARWRRAAAVVGAARAVLPKTEETIALLDRCLLTTADKQPFEFGMEPAADDPAVPFGVPDPTVMARVEREISGRSAAWVITTSCLCEAVIFGLTAWLFCRRDF
jgi:ABC-type transport system involved in multi-copper enzyme maturation permease subunit